MPLLSFMLPVEMQTFQVASVMTLTTLFLVGAGRALFSDMVPALPRRFEIRFVEGYSEQGKLVEVEVTALRDV